MALDFYFIFALIFLFHLYYVRACFFGCSFLLMLRKELEKIGEISVEWRWTFCSFCFALLFRLGYGILVCFFLFLFFSSGVEILVVANSGVMMLIVIGVECVSFESFVFSFVSDDFRGVCVVGSRSVEAVRGGLVLY
jgi:hypothetical protein